MLRPGLPALILICLLACHPKAEDRKIQPDLVNTQDTTNPESAQPTPDSLRQYQKSDWLLVAGKSAGKTEINQNADIVFKNLGKPDGGDAAMGQAVAIWYADHDSTAYATSIYTSRDMGNNPSALVKQIRITSPSFKTKENLGVNSHLADIRKVYKLERAEKFRDASQEYTVWDNKDGIAFEIGKNGRCVAVIIHEAGKTIPGTYLKFRTTNRFTGTAQK
jgi:hypothetical protein